MNSAHRTLLGNGNANLATPNIIEASRSAYPPFLGALWAHRSRPGFPPERPRFRPPCLPDPQAARRIPAGLTRPPSIWYHLTSMIGPGSRRNALRQLLLPTTRRSARSARQAHRCCPRSQLLSVTEPALERCSARRQDRNAHLRCRMPRLLATRLTEDTYRRVSASIGRSSNYSNRRR